MDILYNILWIYYIMATVFNEIHDIFKANFIKRALAGIIFPDEKGSNMNINLGQQGGAREYSHVPTKSQIEGIKRILQAKKLMDFTGLVPLTNVTLLQIVELLGQDGTVKTLDNPNLVGGFKEDAKRELGFLLEEEKADRMLMAIADPKQFLEQEQRNRIQINDRALSTYNEAYDQYIMRGFTKEQAHKKAMEAAKSFRGKLMEQHNIDYKGDFVDKVRTSLLVKR